MTLEERKKQISDMTANSINENYQDFMANFMTINGEDMENFINEGGAALFEKMSTALNVGDLDPSLSKMKEMVKQVAPGLIKEKKKEEPKIVE